MNGSGAHLVPPHAEGPWRFDGSHRVVVIGGGIAGVAAATILGERGFQVCLVEKQQTLGGRAGAWTDRLATGEPFEMERGFHAFFRQYYNLRALLRRIDPELSLLQPLGDYPILGPNGSSHSFAGLPLRTPQNVMALTLRTPTIGWRDLLRIDKVEAMRMLAFDPERSYARWDGRSAQNYLDSLRFPEDARRLLFDVFAHSFFNPEETMSAGELLMMFHFYFTGNPEGLVFDVCNRPFSHAIWEPFERFLAGVNVEIRKGEGARCLRRKPNGGWLVECDDAELAADSVVIATTVGGLQRLAENSPDMDDPELRSSIGSLELTLPFAVWRIWVDGATTAGRAPFAGTTGMGVLDNISLYQLFEDESRAWAEATGGSVIELHAYAVDPKATETQLKTEMLQALHECYPETAGLNILEERFLLLRDCPAFTTGSHERRPTVKTQIDGLVLAGDFVRLPFPSALMERAAASGFLAANYLMGRLGVKSEPIHSIPPRGILASLPLA